MGLMVAAGVATAVTVGTVLESVAAVGAVLSVVGAVTKSPILSKVGMGLGIVGGVGALASNALGIGSAALFGPPDGLDSPAAAVISSGDGTGGAIDSGTWDAAPASGVTDTMGGTAAAGSSDTTVGGQLADTSTWDDAPATTASSPAVAPPAGANPVAAATNPQAVAQNAINSPEQLTLASTSEDTGTGTQTTAAPANTTATVAGQPGTPTGPQPVSGQVDTGTWDNAPAGSSDPGVLDKIVNYAGNHPVVALGALQAAGTLLTGLTSTLTPAQVAQLNSQAAANNAAAALTKQQTANLAMPRAVASSTPVTGTPATLVPQVQLPGQPGIINSQQSQAA